MRELGDKDDDENVTAPSRGRALSAEGTLVIHSWYEREIQSEGFRARIIFDNSANERQVVSTASPQEVLQVVKDWLDSQVRQ